MSQFNVFSMNTKHLFGKSMTAFVFSTLLILGGSCTEKNLYQGPETPEKPSINDLFDYSTEQALQINIDYGFKEYIVLFEIYEENPLTEEDGSIVKKDTEPLYRASTDKSGKCTGTINIPAYITEVWLYSDFIGTVSPVKLEISNAAISYNQNEYLAASAISTRAAMATPNGKYSYPDEFKIFGEWTNKWGTPEYMLDRKLPPAGVLYDINKFYRYAGDYKISINHKELLEDGVPADLNIKKATKMYLTFLKNGASMRNLLGYYTYPTGSNPTKESIQKIIAFPHTSNYYDNNGNRKGCLVSGDRAQLKYWDGQKFVEEFPKDVTIGWILLSNCFDDSGNIKVQSSSKYRYSTPSFNDYNGTNKDELKNKGIRRAVSLRTAKDNKVVAIGFEDNIDMNYTDAIFYVEYSTSDAIDPDLPELPDSNPPSSEDNYSTYKGTLAFEDQWPMQGDYDMNDLVIYYESKVYKTIISNMIVKTEDVFTIINKWTSAQFQNGFGYQLSNINNDVIKSVTIDGPGTSSYMEGKMIEPGQSHPTVILFDNQKDAIDKTFKVTTEFTGELTAGLVQPPYNPFIIIKANEGRGRELHLATLPETTNNYKPTDKAEKSYFGNENDLTGVIGNNNVYYIANDYMPFAIHISGIKFDYPDESQKITDAYSKFSSWASSKGDKDKEWYKNK